jgi:hypothetical protein
VPGLNALYGKPFDDQRTFSDVVHFVHVYVVEAHPLAPDPAPHAGIVVEGPYSTVVQPRTYPQRLENARSARCLIEGGQLQLVDALDPDGQVNPVWCTYGPSPNSAYLIGRDGTVLHASVFTQMHALEEAIRAALAP